MKYKKNVNKNQNMNYGLYIHYEKNWMFWNVSLFSYFCPQKSKVFRHCWCILYNKLLTWISDSDSLYWALYGNMVWKHFLWFLRFFKKLPRSVNNVRTMDFLEFGGDLYIYIYIYVYVYIYIYIYIIKLCQRFIHISIYILYVSLILFYKWRN